MGSAWLERPGLGPGGRRFEPVTPIFTNMREWLSWWSATSAKVEAAGSSPVSRSFIIAEALIHRGFRFLHFHFMQTVVDT